MFFVKTAWYALFAWLGLSTRQDAPATEVTVPDSCHGLVLNNAVVNCTDVGYILRCIISCDGNPKGDPYTCTAVDGWKPDLPPCVKPFTVSSNAYLLENKTPIQRAVCNPDDCDRVCRWVNRKGYCRGDSCSCELS